MGQVFFADLERHISVGREQVDSSTRVIVQLGAGVDQVWSTLESRRHHIVLRNGQRFREGLQVVTRTEWIVRENLLQIRGLEGQDLAEGVEL